MRGELVLEGVRGTRKRERETRDKNRGASSLLATKTCRRSSSIESLHIVNHCSLLNDLSIFVCRELPRC